MTFAEYERLRFERRGPGVLLITMDRPDKYNAADEQMHGELARVWTEVSADPQTRVAVITGAGKAFSAGGDLEMVRRMAGDHDRVAHMLSEASDLVYNLINCEKPVVSAINGVAVGAGAVVALLADISICAEDAQLGDGHVKLGVAAGDHAAIVWPLLCGMAKARYYLLTGEMISGAEAERIGLVSKVVPRDQVLDEALRVADTLAAGSQLAIRWTRRALNNWLKMAGPIFDQSAAYEMLSFMGPDVVEGTAALTEKRAPRFPSAQRRLFGFEFAEVGLGQLDQSLATAGQDGPGRVQGEAGVKTRASARGRPGCARMPLRATVGTRTTETAKEPGTMSDTLSYQQMDPTARGQTHALFSQTMGYVAATAALFALGAWLGRDLTGGVGIVLFIAAFACLIAMRFAARRSLQLTVGLLAAFGLLIGLAVAPVVAYYGSMDPRALWEAGGATALFIAGFGAAGYATRRDLSAVARVLFWALLALIVFGIVLIFVNIPGGDLVYSILGLVIFAGFTMFDFQRLRTNTDVTSAPFLAASIFLDVLNVFLFFLEIFSGSQSSQR
jgi:enoyl-CoA hydratase